MSRTRRSSADRLRGLLSLLVILVLLAAIPAALIALRGNPLPGAGLDGAGVLDALTRPDDGSLFLGALTWLAWAGWASFAVSIATETLAQLRGLPSPHLPALGPQQRLAAALVGTTMLLLTAPLLTAPAALAAPAAAPSTPTATPAQSGSTTVPPVATVTTQATGAERPPAATVSYTVQPGDSLWQIAAEQLGDGARYPEIAQASVGTQSDGGRLTDPDLIRPGWELTLPGTSAAPSAAPAAAEPAPAVEAAPAPALVPPTPAVEPAPSPSPSPSPAAEAPAAQAPAPVPAQTAGPQTAASADTDTDTGQDLDDEPAVPVRTAAGVGGLLAAGLLVLLGARRARQQRHRRPGQRIAMPPPELAPAELALRLVEDPVGLTRVDRALRTLSRTLGDQGAFLPPLRLVRLAGHDLELYLAAPAELPAPFTPTGDPSVWTLPADAQLLTAEQAKTVPSPYPSLVTLGHDLDDAHLLVDLEHTGSLRIDGAPDSSLEVVLAIACELAGSGWADDLQVTLIGGQPQLALLPRALGATRVRHLSSLTELLPSLQHRATDVCSALTHHRLTDLNQARTGLTGQRADVWTPEIVLLTGPTPPDELARLEAVVQQLPRVGVAAVTTATLSADEWTLTLDPTDAGPNATAVLAPVNLTLRPQRIAGRDLDQLLALLEVANRPADDPIPDSPFAAAAVTAAEPTLADLGRDIDHAAANRPTAPVPSPTVRRPWWRPDDDVGAAARQPAASPTDGAAAATAGAVPDDAEPVTQIDLDSPAGDDPPADRPPLIQVLGPVEVLHARGTTERSKQRQLTEIAAYLALHPGLDHTHLTEAIWPGARTVDNTRNTALSKLRKWLGTDPDGVNYVPRVDDGYRLHPAVRSDWQLWQDLLPHGPATADTQALACALELVKGKPFAGTNPRRYAWAEVDRQNMISGIVDAAHELARRALLEADATLARRAAAAGLQADPGAELLWRDALRAEWFAGDMHGLTSTADRLSALVDDLDDELEPDTIELLQQLLNRPASHATAR